MKGQCMKRSKLEINIDILKAIARKGPLKLTHIMQNANTNCEKLKEYLDFLMKQGLIDEQIGTGGRIFYKITLQGSMLLKSFGEIILLLPRDEEENQTPADFQTQYLKCAPGAVN
jgi:predicted transcriptional regulator